MNWRQLLFFVSVAITVISLFLYIFFNIPFLFLFFFLPPIFLYGHKKEEKLNTEPRAHCKNCGMLIAEKNFQFCPYCGKNIRKNGVN
ncbi:MAG: hypothetical protein ACTSRG_01440 [Candidatus Helarchaeota archaeon]